jgi:hypothetical protein
MADPEVDVLEEPAAETLTVCRSTSLVLAPMVMGAAAAVVRVLPLSSAVDPTWRSLIATENPKVAATCGLVFDEVEG